MGMLRFSDSPPEVFVVPRLEDELIDELFYQEDEIGEMRHTAFMIECGLEEDPPDGPDVAPIPWLDNYSDTSSVESAPKPKSPKPQKLEPVVPEKEPPKRVSSLDEEKVASPKKEPRRKLVAAKSGTLHGMRKPLEHSESADHIDEHKSPTRRKLVAAKSGCLHGMRQAASKAKEEKTDKSPVSPRRKLIAVKSGSLHGMRQSTREERKQEKEEATKSPTKVPTRGKLVATKSGSGLSRVRKNDDSKDDNKRVPARKTSLTQADDSVHQARRKVSHTLRGRDPKDSDEEDSDSDVSISDDEDAPKTRRGPRGTVSAGISTKDSPPKNPARTVQSRLAAVEKKNEETKESNGKADVGDAVSNLRNGKKSAAELLRNMQNNRSGPPKKASSVSVINVPPSLQRPAGAGPSIPVRNNRLPSIPAKSTSVSNIGVSPDLQRPRVRPPGTGTNRVPMKFKSAGNLDIPPAFRAIANKSK